MTSWKTLRRICLILLLIPIVHLVYLVSKDTAASLDSSPEVWANEIDAYVHADRASHLPKHPIVVVGGRRVKLWTGLEDLLAPQPVLMRGLGDAIVDDIVYNYERLIGYYRPDTVVFLPGNSEFHIRDNKSAEDLATGIRKLVELDDMHQITRRFYIVTPLKTPLYPGDNEKVEEASGLLQAWAATEPRVVILDANALLCNADGSPKANYYRADGVNLNEHGYLRLSTLLQLAIEQDTVETPDTDA